MKKCCRRITYTLLRDQFIIVITAPQYLELNVHFESSEFLNEVKLLPNHGRLYQ